MYINKYIIHISPEIHFIAIRQIYVTYCLPLYTPSSIQNTLREVGLLRKSVFVDLHVHVRIYMYIPYNKVHLIITMLLLHAYVQIFLLKRLLYMIINYMYIHVYTYMYVYYIMGYDIIKCLLYALYIACTCTCTCYW